MRPIGVDLHNQSLTGDLHCSLTTAQGHGAPAVLVPTPPPGGDMLVALVARVVARLEAGDPAPVKVLADDLGWSWSTCQRLHAEARRRGWLDAAGAPTLEGLVACGRV